MVLELPTRSRDLTFLDNFLLADHREGRQPDQSIQEHLSLPMGETFQKQTHNPEGMSGPNPDPSE